LSPWSPDVQYIPVEVFEIVLRRPKHEQWTPDTPPGLSICFAMFTIYPQSGSIVLAHGMDRRRIMDRTTVIIVRFFAHQVRSGWIPGVWIGGYDSFGWFRGLSHEEPVPPTSREVSVAAIEGFNNRDRIEDSQVTHVVGMIQGQSKRHVSTAVVTDHGESIMTKFMHEG